MTATGRRVRFLADYDYKPTPMSTVAYREGETHFVRLECAERAVRLGKAVLVRGRVPSGVADTIARKSRKKRNG